MRQQVLDITVSSDNLKKYQCMVSENVFYCYCSLRKSRIRLVPRQGVEEGEIASPGQRVLRGWTDVYQHVSMQWLHLSENLSMEPYFRSGALPFSSLTTGLGKMVEGEWDMIWNGESLEENALCKSSQVQKYLLHLLWARYPLPNESTHTYCNSYSQQELYERLLKQRKLYKQENDRFFIKPWSYYLDRTQFRL